MIHVLTTLPRELTVACSGGVDSMAVVDFLRRNHSVTVAYFDHHTHHGVESKLMLHRYCADHNLRLITAEIEHQRPKHESMEEFWRNQRYEFLHSIPGCVVTAHHLDDCVETYLFNCVHGKHHTIPHVRANVIRPFLTTRKTEFESWCSRKAVPYVSDPSNQDFAYMRNIIRHQIVPEALRVNPGLHTVVRKMVLDSMSK
jgi:tRNA(Ile)-lysidine synthetase-like protein